MEILVTDRQGITHVLVAEVGNNLMSLIVSAGLGLDAICGGGCSCGTCHVYVSEAWASRLPKADDDELFLLEETGEYRVNYSRLSCQLELNEEHAGLEVTVAPPD